VGETCYSLESTRGQGRRAKKDERYMLFSVFRNLFLFWILDPIDVEGLGLS